MAIVELPKTAKRILDSRDYIDVDGSVYTIDRRNRHRPVVIKKAQHLCNGYSYCGIYSIHGKKPVSKRVHRLVAEAYIPNPKHLPVVGHKNNIKSDNRVENLYWTTPSQNTQKAFDDGLAFNAAGIDDSQSKPVRMFSTITNKEMGTYGSITEAAKQTGLPQTTISRQAKYKRPVRRPYYFRYLDDPDCTLNQELVGMFDYNSERLIKTFINIGQAATETGFPKKTIEYQCSLKTRKPKDSRREVYFRYLSSSCE